MIQQAMYRILAGEDANIIFHAKYETMTDEATITVIATGIGESIHEDEAAEQAGKSVAL